MLGFVCCHDSDLGVLLAGGALGAQGFLFPPQSSLDAMRLILGKDVGPLGDSGRADVTRQGGGGDGPTKQINCGFLFHAPDFSALRQKSKPLKNFSLAYLRSLL